MNPRQLQLLVLLSVVLLAGLFVAVSWRNSLAVESISIRIKEGVKEHLDHAVFGLGGAHQLPDYKVKLHVSRRFLAVDLGTKLNASATNWLEFAINDEVPLRRLQEVVIIEDDKIENDVIDRIQGTGLEREGASFQCRLTTSRSFEVGMNWFFGTPLGKTIASAVVLGTFLLIALLLRRSL